MSDYTVLWDGRRNGPGGAQLAIPEEAHTEPPALRHMGRGEYARTAVLEALQHGEKSNTQLVAVCGLTQDAVNQALRDLRRVGAIESRREQPRHGSVFGRRVETVYGLR